MLESAECSPRRDCSYFTLGAGVDRSAEVGPTTLPRVWHARDGPCFGPVWGRISAGGGGAHSPGTRGGGAALKTSGCNPRQQMVRNGRAIFLSLADNNCSPLLIPESKINPRPKFACATRHLSSHGVNIQPAFPRTAEKRRTGPDEGGVVGSRRKTG